MMSLRCVVIDDDRYAIENLRESINSMPSLSLIGAYNNPLEALREIPLLDNFDILFIDVQLPMISGIELAPLIRKKSRFMVIISSYPEYALDAFNVEADGYLLKPYSLSNFVQLITNLLGETEKVAMNTMLSDGKLSMSIIGLGNERMQLDPSELLRLGKSASGPFLVTEKNIFFCQADGFEPIFESFSAREDFIRVTEHDIISKSAIRKISLNKVVLSNGDEICLENKYLKRFKSFVRSKLLG